MKKIVILTILALLLVSCSKSKKEIVIGGLFPLSGSTATFGQSSKQAMELAVAEVNQAGGIMVGGVDLPVRAVYEDDEGQPEKAANACQKLISKDGVIAIIGAVASKNSLAIAPICQESRVPMISSASTNEKVTEAGDFIFRACFIDPFQGMVMAKYAGNTLKAKKAAVIYDNGNDYNKGLAQVFSKKFEEYGGTIVAREAFTDEANTVDFKAQLTNIKAAAPDFLYCPNYYAADAMIMKQSKEIGLSVPTGGGDGWDSPKLVEIGGASVEGCVFSNHFSKDDTGAVVRNFVDKYKQQYNDKPDALASLAYDAAVILMSAIKKTGSLDPDALKEAIKTSPVAGVSGNITFDEKRNPIKSAVILKIKDGKQVFVERVAP
ncbi:MAG TPA: ABC transporter substrate-binding protein [Chitinivibrionales bacterium]|nr:ABC transporter substrate-binding protein [Chitinivibrionales bacterium]